MIDIDKLIEPVNSSNTVNRVRLTKVRKIPIIKHYSIPYEKAQRARHDLKSTVLNNGSSLKPNTVYHADISSKPQKFTAAKIKSENEINDMQTVLHATSDQLKRIKPDDYFGIRVGNNMIYNFYERWTARIYEEEDDMYYYQQESVTPMSNMSTFKNIFTDKNKYKPITSSELVLKQNDELMTPAERSNVLTADSLRKVLIDAYKEFTQGKKRSEYNVSHSASASASYSDNDDVSDDEPIIEEIEEEIKVIEDIPKESLTPEDMKKLNELKRKRRSAITMKYSRIFKQIWESNNIDEIVGEKKKPRLWDKRINNAIRVLEEKGDERSKSLAEILRDELANKHRELENPEANNKPRPNKHRDDKMNNYISYITKILKALENMKAPDELMDVHTDLNAWREEAQIWFTTLDKDKKEKYKKSSWDTFNKNIDLAIEEQARLKGLNAGKEE